MTEKLKEIIKEKDFLIPKLLFLNYKKLKITSEELIFIIYIINTSDIFNPKQISNDLNINLNEVMNIMEELTSKNIIKLEVKKNGNIRNEYINLDLLYDKLIFSLEEKKPKETNIYSIFEQELGRPISPMEYEIIGTWIENGTKEETIKLALKEAIYNGANNFRYIDKIINDWAKKGIKTSKDIETSRKKFKKQPTNNEILNYDWLNDE